MEDDPSLFFQAEESGKADYLSLPSTVAPPPQPPALRQPLPVSSPLFASHPAHPTLSCAHARSGIRQRGGAMLSTFPTPASPRHRRGIRHDCHEGRGSSVRPARLIASRSPLDNALACSPTHSSPLLSLSRALSSTPPPRPRAPFPPSPRPPPPAHPPLPAHPPAPAGRVCVPHHFLYPAEHFFDDAKTNLRPRFQNNRA